MRDAQKGFTLLEGLISLFLFLVIVLFSLECFLAARRHFHELNESESANTAAYAALDRMRMDVRDAGLGLAEAMCSRVLEGVYISEGELVVLSKDVDIAVGEALVSGQQRIPTPDANKIKKGRQLGIFDRYGGEVHSVSSIDQSSVVIDLPLTSNYALEDIKVILLRKISLFMDEAKGIIRRRVNASSAQPLLEAVAAFEFDHAKDSNLVSLGFSLKSNEEKMYESTVYPKNTAMAAISKK
jgi:hypothetical protein